MKNEFEVRQIAYVERINAALDQLLSPTAHPASKEYDRVRQAMAYSVEAGGKRIRPLLTLEFARLYGGKIEAALPLACAVEFIHTYSLIHDDLPCMDDDDLRRGKPSCHKQFSEGEALLAGDGLLTLAFEVIASAPERAGTDVTACLKACKTLASLAGIDGMVGGQVMDLVNENRLVEEADLRKTYLLKTSALLRAACELGVLSAGAGVAAVKAAGEYAERLGVAFQIVDDLLDVTGDEKALGKPIGSDADCGKTTFVTLFGQKEARACAERATREALEAALQLPDNAFLLELTRGLLVRSF